jgi:hypothetical protein
MASQKQRAANKKNAQNSTGPKSEKGKAKSRLNSTRDGITGQVTTLSDEDRPIFESLKAELIADLAPKTVMELNLASSIAWETWRLNRLRAVEMNLFALGTEDPATAVACDDPHIHTAMTAARTMEEKADKFARMSLYEQRMNRALHKNLATLRDLQAERKRACEKERAEEVLIARHNDLKGLPYQAPATATQNGFVFSNNEIFAAAHRESVLEIAKVTVNQLPYKVQFAGASGSGNSGLHPDLTSDRNSDPITDRQRAEQATRYTVRKPATSAQFVSATPNKRYSIES